MIELHRWWRPGRGSLVWLSLLAFVAGCGKDKEGEESPSEPEGSAKEEKATESAEAESDEKPAAKDDAEKGSRKAAGDRKTGDEAVKPAEGAAAAGSEGDGGGTPNELRERLRKRNEERRAAMAAARDGATPATPAARPEVAAMPPSGRPAPGEVAPPSDAEPAALPAEPPPAAPHEAAQPPPAQLPVAASAVGLDLSHLLTVEDVRKTTSEKALMPAGSLSGIAPSPAYNSAYFAPPKRAEFGVSLQVWKERSHRDSSERFRRMKRDYPNSQETTAVTANGFFSSWQDIMTLSFMNFEKRTIVSVSCSTKVCSQAQLLELATAVKGRL